MLKQFFSIFAFFLIAAPFFVEAQSNAGTADYAMLSPAWPCQDARKSETKLKVLRKSILWNTFGNDTACLSQYMSDQRLELLEIHLINEACIRNNRCGPYEFLSGLTPSLYQEKLLANDPELIDKLKKYLQAPADFLKTNLKSHTKCFISPGLESNLSVRAAKILIETVRPLFPQCQMVWNPVGINRSRPIAQTTFEVHGSKIDLNSPCIANLDGEDINFPTRPAILPNYIESKDIPSYLKKYSQCQANFLWIAEQNGLSAGPFIDPRERRNFPTFETFSLLASLIPPD